MHTFPLRDLSAHSGELVRETEAGRLSLVTRDGEPLFVAVPFDDILLREGVNVALAIKLFDEEALSLAQAARLAGLPLAEFMEKCSADGIPMARYSPGELEQELRDFDVLHRGG